jgi:hypothetical protein
VNDDLREYYHSAPIPKPTPTPKAARRRLRVRPVPANERKQRDLVRAKCVERDGSWCRVQPYRYNADVIIADVFPFSAQLWRDCEGEQEWAHMHIRRRSKTRNMDPTYRHDTAHSLMLCHRHHDDYDAKRLAITCLSRKGADGPLKFRRAK